MKRRVLILCNKLSGGGIQKVMQDVANYFASHKDKYQVTVVALESPERTTDLLDSSIKIITCYRNKASYKKYSPAWILHLLQRSMFCAGLIMKKHDIVLVIKDGWYIKLGGMMKAKCKIGWFHTASIEQPHWTRLFFRTDEEEQACLATYNHIICVSEFGKREVERTIGEVKKMTVLYNPVNVNKIIELSEEPVLIPEASIRPIFILVNRLSPIKNTMKLLRCIKKLNENYLFSLWIVGDGEERCEIEEYIRTNNMNNIFLLGWKKNPYPYIKASDCLISVSAYETFGLTIQEAAVINTPSIAVDIPAFVECAPKSKTLIIRDNEDDIVEGIKMVLDNPNLLIDYKKARDDMLSHKQLYTDRLKGLERLVVGDDCKK